MFDRFYTDIKKGNKVLQGASCRNLQCGVGTMDGLEIVAKKKHLSLSEIET
jgi:hypothetical protein